MFREPTVFSIIVLAATCRIDATTPCPVLLRQYLDLANEQATQKEADCDTQQLSRDLHNIHKFIYELCVSLRLKLWPSRYAEPTTTCISSVYGSVSFIVDVPPSKPSGCFSCFLLVGAPTVHRLYRLH